MALNADDLKNKGIFAPTAIDTTPAGTAFDVSGYAAINVPAAAEYYINEDSANKITRAGIIWIHPTVTELVFTGATPVEVMG